MGLSTSILFELNSYIPIDEFIIKLAEGCKIEKLSFRISDERYDKDGNLKYCWATVGREEETEEYKDMYMSIYNEKNNVEYNIVELDIVSEYKEYFRMVNIEEIYGYEYMALKFCYIVLKLYPQAKVWIEENWFYTLEDLEKIRQKPFDKNWCYEKPKNI